MPYRALIIWIEGQNRDLKFFEKIVKTKLEGRYFDKVDLSVYNGDEIKGSNMQEYIRNYLRSISSINRTTSSKFEYIFVHDFDSDICISNKKQWIKRFLPQLNIRKIIIVKEEIESWFLAGLNDENCRKLKIPNFENTETVTKEQFDDVKPVRFKYDSDFLREIFNLYSINTAKEKNASFEYFSNRYNLQ